MGMPNSSLHNSRFLLSYNNNAKSHNYRQLTMAHCGNVFRVNINGHSLGLQLSTSFDKLAIHLKSSSKINIMCPLDENNKESESDTDSDSDIVDNTSASMLEFHYTNNSVINEFISDSHVLNISYLTASENIGFDFLIGLDDQDYKYDLIHKLENIAKKIKIDFKTT
jgi:hypothetical protein